MDEDMTRWVALLRGVNVGGVKVAMADLRAAAEGLGWRDAQTYIASGQMVFRAAGEDDALAGDLRTALKDRAGVDTPVMVLPKVDLDAALADCPFEPEEGSHVHVFFLWDAPEVDIDAYHRWKADDEELKVDGRRAWLHAPSGIGRSKLAERLDKVLKGTDMTARNLNTVRRLAEMLDAMDAEG
ncbi:hypothetical protein Wenmar_03529 [Wenxinia marina DSM 24838]|uniref:DUF1697 domain-containing protein n=2 Tax=Wenxinia TaxID=653686 RepID=A0A0D0NHJ2_9RHOB|nr:DUF1697 domain-containing protein [Wenxinia marina]KIQ67800.1 hypothetical protein Wenmar_03529 [Wenxinia marina DSM 24838]